jgi:hypothetical protein
MNGFKIGDKVVINNRPDWGCTDPGYVLAGSKGTVAEPNWVKWEETTKDFGNFVYVKLEDCKVKDYIGNTFMFRVENISKR